MPNNKLTVSEQTVPKTVSIRDMSVGQFGKIEDASETWYVHCTYSGVLFLNDFDFFTKDGPRMKLSTFMVEILPKGTVIHLESTVTV